MASLINIGVNGLLSHQSALNTTGNNITNANTPGYSRQRVELATLPEHLSGNGYIGQGGTVTGINRIVDQFLINQLRSDTSSFHQTDSMTTLYSQLDSLLADSSTGLAPALQGFFDSLQQASLDPTSVPIRQVVLRSAGTLAQRFDAIYSQLQSQERVINEQLTALTGQANRLAEGIAALNQQISQQSNAGAQPNALLDKRDELTRQLSELVGVSVVDQGNGMVNISIGRGQPLVVGNQAYSLGTQPSAHDVSRSEIVLNGSGGGQEIGQFLTGGQIGGLLAYRSEALDKTFNQLGQMALSIAEQFNTVQQQGMDLDGDYGAQLPTLFDDINSSALMAGRAIPLASNASAARLNVEITDASRLTASDYRATWDDATGAWSIAVEPGGTKTYTEAELGFRLTPRDAAVLADGDSFLIRPTRQGAGSLAVTITDPRDLALAKPPLQVEPGGLNNGSGIVEVVSNHPVSGPDLSLLSDLGVTIVPNGAGFNLQVDMADAGSLTQPLTSGSLNVVTLRFDEAATAPASPWSLDISPASTMPAPQPEDVLRFTLSGYMAAGDTFKLALHQTPNGTSDNNNALAMLDMRFDKLIGANVSGGGQTFAASYTSLVTDVGARTAELKINQEAADSILVQSQANRDATSGVNLDEEAANLIRFEQAYNASAQVISVARSLFDSLLAAFR